VSRTRCSVPYAAPQSRDPWAIRIEYGPRISSAPRRESGALRSIRGTHRSFWLIPQFQFQTAITPTVIASGAKQSISPHQESMDCFVASLLAMTARYTFTFPRRNAPELCKNFCPQKNRGRRESRVPVAPAAARGVVVSTRVSHHRFTGTPGLPCAMVLTAYFALSPVTGLVCHRRSRGSLHET
jgi:hypothetical protein